MMLNALSITSRIGLGDSEQAQELQNSSVALAAGSGKVRPSLG